MAIFHLQENIVKIKRGEIFIRSIPFVLKNFPEQKFKIIGEKGNAYVRLSQLADKLDISNNIEFTGLIDYSDIPRLLQQAKIYVQISDSETFGLSVAEAMSCGTPVVVSRQGAIPEVVGDCGIYVDHNDPNAVANGIIDLLNKNETERFNLGLKARRRIVENFTYEQRKENIKQIISAL